ncbi:MAG: protein kinase [Lachnospiraceae bacterium]|nr:protein kinase [Lachnospiraceae bacterium]
MEKFSDTYEIIGKLGEGSGGIVYKAIHKRLRKEVVVKQIKNQGMSLRDKRKEVDILKNLNHSYLPQVLDFFEIGGNAYTVMSFIPGKSLKTLLQEGRYFQKKEVIRWAMQLCSALQYLHEQMPPIIHGDIKPANIMLTPKGDICLIDFNISFFMNSGTVLGYTDGYTSPEQYRRVRNIKEGIREEFVKIDERADLYSLGATLYHIITGEKLGENGGRPDQMLLTEKAGDTFASVIERAVEQDPKKRFQSAAEMLQALQMLPKKDKRYKMLLARQWAERLTASICLAGCIALTGYGIYTMRLEKIERYNELVAKQEKLIADKKFDKEEEIYREAVKLRPSSLESYYQNAYALYEQKLYEECIEFIDYDILQNEKVKQSPERMADIYYLKADSQFQMEDYEDAVETYELLEETGEGAETYYKDYAITLAYAGYPESAEKILEEAMEQGLNEDTLYYAKGEIKKFLEEPEQALTSFQKCIEITKDMDLKTRAYLMMSELYEKEDNREQEQKMLKEAEASLPVENQMMILERLAQVNIDLAENTGLGKYREEAIKNFQKIIENGWESYDTYNNLVVLCQKQGNLDQAEKYLKTMEESYGEDYNIYKRHAFLEIDRQKLLKNDARNYKKFEEYYEQATELYEDEKESDIEMDLLEQLYDQAEKGGWL